jgi:hypothetical protein
MKRDGYEVTETEVGVMWPQVKGCWNHKALEEAGRTLPWSLQRSMVLPQLDF